MGGSSEGIRHSMIDLLPEALQKANQVANGIVAYIPHVFESRNHNGERIQDELEKTLAREKNIYWSMVGAELKRLSILANPTPEDQYAKELWRTLFPKPPTFLQGEMPFQPDRGIPRLMEEWKQQDSKDNT